MITTEGQYRAALNKLSLLRPALEKPAVANLPAEVEAAARQQTLQLVREIEEEIREYESR